MNNADRQRLNNFSAAQTDRMQYEGLWRSLSRNFLPRRIFDKPAPGTNPYAHLYDSLPPWGLKMLATVVYGSITPPNAMMFNLRYDDDALNRDLDARDYLRAVNNQMWMVLNRPGSGFYRAMLESWQDLLTYGNASAYVSDEGDSIRVLARPLPEIYVETDALGNLHRIYRKYTEKAYALSAIGIDLPGNLASDSRRNETVTCVQIVEATNDSVFRFRSWHYMTSPNEALLRTGGYYSMPFTYGHWETNSGETYGSGLVQSLLPNARGLQAMKKALLDQVMLQGRPPTMFPSNAFATAPKIVPGGMLPYNPGLGEIKPLVLAGDLAAMSNAVENERREIQRGLMLDMILPLLMREGNSPLKAQEVVGLQSETMKVIGPFIPTIETTHLGPIVDRVFDAMDRRRMFPPAPARAQGASFRPRYASNPELTADAKEINNIERFFYSLSQLAGMSPNSLQMVKFDAILRDLVRLRDLPSNYIADEEAAEVAGELEAAAQGAAITKDFGQGAAALANAGLLQ